VITCLGQEITGGAGVDIAVEALGKPQTFVQCFNCVRDGGKAVMVGLTQSGAIGEVDINRLVRKKVHTLPRSNRFYLFVQCSY
jgi:threonine dehydrogenase-like Zn-dependent dehydrogenase